MRALIFAIILAISGCATQETKLHIERVEVPIPVPCNIIAPKKPVMPFTESVNTDIPGTKPDLFGDVRRMLAEIENRKGYESELEAAIKSCNSK